MSNIVKTKPDPTAKPFVKWLGGKTKLLPQLTAMQPDSFNRYYEPFIGGGALFFSLMPGKAVINDLNPHLVNLYTQVRDNLDTLLLKAGELIDIYLELDDAARDAFYYLIRDEFNQRTDDDTWGASMFLFLNKTCYNGVYRENANGKFNVPFGRRKTISLHDLDSIKLASEALKGATILNGSYADALKTASKDDFIYLDPPYVPLNATSNFTQYVGSNFGNKEHIELKAIFEELHKRGCKIMMSNSDTEVVRNLYKDFKLTEVLAERAVNCKAQGRGKITELVITNY
jgi:DNA adenine methylase